MANKVSAIVDKENDETVISSVMDSIKAVTASVGSSILGDSLYKKLDEAVKKSGDLSTLLVLLGGGLLGSILTKFFVKNKKHEEEEAY